MDRGTIFLGDLFGFGPSRLSTTHLPAGLSFTDTLNEGRVTSFPTETPAARAALSHPTLAPSIELIGLVTLAAFLWYMDSRIKVVS